MSNSNVKWQKPRWSNLILILKSHLSMRYENQLLFYKEALQHRNKNHVFTRKSQNFPCSLFQRTSTRHTVELHPLLFKSIPFCKTLFFSFILLGGVGIGSGVMSRERHMINILILWFYFFFPVASHYNDMSFNFREIFLAQWYPFRNMNVSS